MPNTNPYPAKKYIPGLGTDVLVAADEIDLTDLKTNISAAHQNNSVAADVATLVTDFNALLAKLQAAGLMK